MNRRTSRRIPQVALVVAALTPSGVACGQCPITTLEGIVLPQDSQFGRPVDVSSAWAVVGDAVSPPFVDQKGYVAIFRRHGSGWAHAFTLHDPGVSDGGRFGAGVRLADDLVLVRNPDADEGCVEGGVYVYRFDDGEWTLAQSVGAPHCDANGFAWSADFDGERIIVGAPDALNGEREASGAAYVYVRQREGDRFEWNLETTLVDSTGADSDSFGESVAIDGDLAVVGAPHDDGGAFVAGSASFYRRDRDGWTLDIKLAPIFGGEAQFGSVVALRGDIAVITAPFAGIGQSGLAYAYRFDGESWHSAGVLAPEPPTSGVNFGTSTAIAPDGGTVYVGQSLFGKLWAFEANDRGDFEFAYTIVPSAPQGTRTPAAGGDFLLIGGQYEAFLYAAKGATDCNGNGAPDACDIAQGTSGDRDGDGVPDECDAPAPEDLDESGTVDAADLAILLGAWGPCPTANGAVCAADLDASGAVDASDLAVLLGAWGASGNTTASCGSATTDCCAASGAPGCADEACCAAVCAIDPSCCATAWDGFCASQARDACGCPGFATCTESAGDCCTPWGDGTPGCADPDCCAAVCALDAFCCEVTWDGLCYLISKAACGCPDPPVCGPGAGSCCEAHPGPGCDDVACCEATCMVDPFCCELAWDGICAAEAIRIGCEACH